MRPIGREQRVTLGAIAFAVVLLVIGVVLWRSEPESFGWFLYEPLPEQTPILLMTGRRFAALGALGAGLVLLAAVSGFMVGRRGSRRDGTR
jgi:hypothetical protein